MVFLLAQLLTVGEQTLPYISYILLSLPMLSMIPKEAEPGQVQWTFRERITHRRGETGSQAEQGRNNTLAASAGSG